MKPVSPVIPGENLIEVVYAKDQPQYLPLPAFKALDGKVLTRWELTEKERAQVAEQGYIYLAVDTFNQPLQPVMLATRPPDIVKTVEWDQLTEEDHENLNQNSMVDSFVN